MTVAVIEAGPSGDDVEAQIDVPGNSYLNGLTGVRSSAAVRCSYLWNAMETDPLTAPLNCRQTSYDWQYKTVAQPDAGGSVKPWPRGKVLGGSGAINGMFWCRGDKSEYE